MNRERIADELDKRMYRILKYGYYEIPISQLMDMVEEQNERKPNERTAAHGTGMA